MLGNRIIKKIACIVSAVLVLTLATPLTGLAYESVVFGFEKNATDFEVPDEQSELSWQMLESYNCIAVRPNYTNQSKIKLLVDQSKLDGAKYAKVRYYIDGEVNSGCYMGVFSGNSIIGKAELKVSDGWETAVFPIEDKTSEEIVFGVILSDDGWTTNGIVYIDYIGFFGSYDEAEGYFEYDDNASVPKSARITGDGKGKISVNFDVENNDRYMYGKIYRKFNPENSITRAEAAVALSRIISGTKSVYTAYNDISEDAWYASGITELLEYGVLEGGGNFFPDDELTRGDAAALLLKAGLFDEKVEGAFTDVDKGDANYSAILSAAAAGVFYGYPDNSFRPAASITRAEFVAVVNRALKINVPEQSDEYNLPFEDVPRSHWAYMQIYAATGGAVAADDSKNDHKNVTLINGKFDAYNGWENDWTPVPIVTQKILDKGFTGGEGGQIAAYICISSDGMNLMSFTDTGGMYRSTDGGENWVPCGRGTGASLSSGEFDPNNPNRVLGKSYEPAYGESKSKPGRYYATENYDYYTDGVFLSEDAGESFVCTMKFSDGMPSWDRKLFAWDASSYDAKINGSAVAYYTSGGDNERNATALVYEKEQGFNNGGGLYKTEDGGYTWTWLTDQFTMSSLEVHPKEGILYIGDEKGFHRSTDGGKTFETTVDGCVTSVDVIDTYPDNVYITCSGKGVMVSEDKGKTFKIVGGIPSEISTEQYYEKMGHLAVCPFDPNKMVMGGGKQTSAVAYYSKDGGASWQETTLSEENCFFGKQKRIPIAVWSPIKENEVFYANADWVSKSFDSGESLDWYQNGNLGACINSPMSVNTFNPDYMFIPIQDYGGAFTFDRGKTFTHVENSPGGGHSYGGYVVDENTIYALMTTQWEAQTCKLVISNDGGKTWVDTGKEADSNARRMYCLQAPGDENVWIAGNLRSTDQGKSWTSMTPGCAAVSSYNPTGKKEMYGTDYDGNVVVSYDNGATWQIYIDAQKIIDASSPMRTTSYIMGSCYDYKNDIFYFINDIYAMKYENGEVSLIEGVTDGARCIEVDQNEPDVIYVGLQHSTVGCLRSCDRGKTWQEITGFTHESVVQKGNPGPRGNIFKIYIDPDDHSAWVPGACFGIYKFPAPYKF